MTWLPWLVAAFAGALIVAGVAFMYWPAALVVAGTLILAALFGPDLE
jgi:ABC-type transport system involved in cytochrome bd biosynthesis fused ATPase/permease subunit